MREDLNIYVSALLVHWRAALTGGFVTALLTAWAAVGKVVSPTVGVAFVLGTLLTASFTAWRDERTRRVLRARITGMAAPDHHPHRHLIFYVLLQNTSREPRAIESVWTLEIFRGGALKATIPGQQLGDQLKPLQPEDQFNIEVEFPVINAATVPDTTYVLTCSDIHGHALEARYPDDG